MIFVFYVLDLGDLVIETYLLETLTLRFKGGRLDHQGGWEVGWFLYNIKRQKSLAEFEVALVFKTCVRVYEKSYMRM